MESSETTETAANAHEEPKREKSKLPIIIILVVILVVLVVCGVFVTRYFMGKQAVEPAAPVEEDRADEVSLELPKLDKDLDFVFFGLEQPADVYEELGDADENVDSSSDSSLDVEASSGPRNMIYSPLSIRYALMMLSEGTAGNTKAQIDAIADPQLPSYTNVEDVLSLANAVFIDEQYADLINSGYKTRLEKIYGVNVYNDPFKSASGINNWISEKTFGQINNIVSDDTVTGSKSSMIFVNALAINMDWEWAFYPPSGEPFYLENGEVMEAATMNTANASDETSYYQDDDITVLAKDLKAYGDTQLQFMALMPNTEKLSDFIEGFNLKNLGEVTEKLIPASETPWQLWAYIPKFKFDYQLDLVEDLKKVGLTEVFSDDADFSPISSEAPISIDAVLHSANIEFYEFGIKAAAVTVAGGLGGAGSEHPDPVIIKINRPFMFVIQDKDNGAIWFTGAVYEPTDWESEKSVLETYWTAVR